MRVCQVRLSASITLTIVTEKFGVLASYTRPSPHHPRSTARGEVGKFANQTGGILVPSREGNPSATISIISSVSRNIVVGDFRFD